MSISHVSLSFIFSNTLKIPHLKIAHLGGNLEVGNIDIQGYQDCPPQIRVVFYITEI